MKILIVEDEKQLLDSILTFLKESGMNCEKAENLAEAIEKIENTNYDCIVLDIGLPDGSGLKVINEMQQKENQTAIVIVSAKNSLDDRLIGLNFGADDLDGTIDDTTKIYSMAGSEEQNPKLSTQELVDLIKAVGRIPVERDTLYNIVKTY